MLQLYTLAKPPLGLLTLQIHINFTPLYRIVRRTPDSCLLFDRPHLDKRKERTLIYLAIPLFRFSTREATS
ncbi:MAG: hypothetical protein ACI8RD_005334 [Bacillariaceae sp.]|jgi:hypothetical protein